MRSLFALASVTALASLAACGGETCPDGSDPVDDECPCADGTYPSDNDDGECDNDPDCETGEVVSNGECRFECSNGQLADDEEDCPFNLNPEAVGFEFDGGFDGEMIGNYALRDSGGELVELLPSVTIQFADSQYFGAGTVEAQLGHHCEAIALFDYIEGTSTLDTDGSTVWTQFDTTLSIVPGSWETDTNEDRLDCGPALNPELWGDNGEDLLSAFTTFRFALGFGPMTDYLRESWQDDAGDWFNEDIESLSTAFMAEYIGINDAQGNFVLEDWTTAFAFEYDPETLEVEVDEDDYLVQIDVTGAEAPPVGYYRSSSYWWQDFPLMDLSNLGEGRPVDDGQ